MSFLKRLRESGVKKLPSAARFPVDLLFGDKWCAQRPTAPVNLSRPMQPKCAFASNSNLKAKI